MPAAVHAIILEEDSDFDLEVTYRAADCTPKDITGYGASFQIQNTSGSTTLVTGSVANGRIILAGTSGVFSLNIPAVSITALTSLIGADARFNMVIWPSAASSAVDPKRLLEGPVTYRRSYATV